MAKCSMVQRELKRTKTRIKFDVKRKQLLEERNQLMKNPDENYDEIIAVVDKLDKLPKNASPSRGRNRCHITGRPRGVYRKFGLCRNKLRELAMLGLIPGLSKASW